MIQLHHYPSTAAMVPHILLEELGVAVRARAGRPRGQRRTRQPAYLRLNPNGLIPVLVDGDLVLYETAAIVLHLCDRTPQARPGAAGGLAATAAHFYKWLAWLTNTLQATLIVYFYPRPLGGRGQCRRASRRCAGMRRPRWSACLASSRSSWRSHAGPWFLGEQYTALDPYVFTLCRWTRNFETGRARDLPPPGSRTCSRVLERPAVQRVLANEQLQPPFV